MKANIRFAIQALFGAIILAAGINKLYLFMPVPEQMPAGKEFIDFLYATGYLMYVVALLEIVGGGLLIFNRQAPLALLLLAPISLNILLFHLFLEQKGLLMGLFIFSLHLVLFFLHWQKFIPLLQGATSAKKETKQQKAVAGKEAA